MSDGEEHGFLWRLNIYWSYEERDGGLYMQIESISLTRVHSDRTRLDSAAVRGERAARIAGVYVAGRVRPRSRANSTRQEETIHDFDICDRDRSRSFCIRAPHQSVADRRNREACLDMDGGAHAAWVTSDGLTAVGLCAQIGAGLFYALSRYHKAGLIGVIVCIVLNWFGDSMDGTLARVRNQQRPRYGFYVDHIVDIFGATALMCGLGCSGFVHWQVAAAMLIAILLLSAESYLATYTLSCFQMSQGIFGPTEIRILLLYRNPGAIAKPLCDGDGASVAPVRSGWNDRNRSDVCDGNCNRGAAHGRTLSAGALAISPTQYAAP